LAQVHLLLKDHVTGFFSVLKSDDGISLAPADYHQAKNDLAKPIGVDLVAQYTFDSSNGSLLVIRDGEAAQAAMAYASE
jgi:hypothetical protein